MTLEGGTFLAAPPARALALTWTARRLLMHGEASPDEIERILGTLQWFDLLNRPKLSVYSLVYKYVQSPRGAEFKGCFGDVMAEIVLGTVLGVYWRTDLTRSFIPMLSASDASTSFGFGVSVAPFPLDLLPAIARWSEKQGAYVVLDDGGALSKPRMGPALELDIKLHPNSDP